MSKKVEDRLSGPHREKYLELCRRHPWFSEASELQEEWSKKVEKIRAMPGDMEENIKVLYTNDRPLTVDDDIAFAKAVQANPDVWWYFEDQERRLQDDPDTQEIHPDSVRVLGAFKDWFFFKQGLPYQRGETMHPAKAIIHKYLRGDFSSVDGPEAQEYALSTFASRYKVQAMKTASGKSQ